MSSDLKALRDIIVSSVDQIIGLCESTGKEFPKLSEPIQLSEFSPDGIRNHPKVSDNIALAVAAAFQLIQTLQSPPVTLTTAAFRHSLPISLGIVERANVAEILRKAGPQGLHVTDIAAQNNIDPKKLARILRFLATNHWFTEVAPDVFANNLLSSLLDTHKEIIPNFREIKHKESPGLAAIAGYGADEVIRAMTEWPDVLFDPKTAFSEELNETGIQKALNIDIDQWAYYDTPEGRYRSDRFNVAMSGASKLHPPQAVLICFDWASVPKNGLVVDVGGSTGHVSLEIAKAFPELNFIVEDRPIVIDTAKKNWAENLQSHIDAKKVHFIGCDFFESQPTLPATPDVFLLRTIIHDWSDKYSIKLLSNLRAAAGPDTKLLLIDSIINYACEAPSESTFLGKDAEPRVPAPLLPNLGGANLLAYEVDVVLGSCLNSGERTIDGYKDIIEASGWKLVEVRKNPASKIWWPALICVPA